jgi:hypothetical protein
MVHSPQALASCVKLARSVYSGIPISVERVIKSIQLCHCVHDQDLFDRISGTGQWFAELMLQGRLRGMHAYQSAVQS